ncbi:DNA repair protein SbcC/Rad50 [uncultured Gammaproteobacteria bacterium]
MRLLAIRGRNLASLAGEFDVNLAAPPLARAGLFAITGPTGAGKSTLLDALCLALFDDFPRRPTTQGPSIGRADETEDQRLGPGDVRAILRRGAVNGWAEVDFEGIDRRRYRARWEVRRARDRANGKLQAQIMALTALDDGARFGDTKTTVLTEIKARLGLDYQQFRRAALLAQGDFAAFLKAPYRERSALLEAITGTELYTRISILADQREKNEKSALDSIEVQRAAVAVLTDERRAETEAEAERLSIAATAAEAETAAAGMALAWRRRADDLAKGIETATAAQAQAQNAVSAAAPRRDELNAVEAAQPLRPLVADADRTTPEAATALRDHTIATEQAEQARQTHDQRQRQSEIAAMALDQARAALATAEPDLAAAVALDTQLATLTPELTRAEAAHTATLARFQAAEQTLDQVRVADAGHAQILGAANRWLEQQRALAPAAEDWPRWERLLRRLAEATRAAVEAERMLAASTVTMAEIDASTEKLATTRAQAAEALDHASRALTALRAAPIEAVAELTARRQGLQTERERLTTLAVLADQAAGVNARHQILIAEAAERRATAEQEEQATTDLKRTLDVIGAQLAEAEATQKRLEQASKKSVKELRAQLVPGEPCSVCGSKTHPWADQAPAYGQMLGEQEQRVKSLATDKQELGMKLGGRQAAARGARERLQKIESQLLPECATEFRTLSERWQKLATAAAAPPLPERPETAGVATVLADRRTVLDNQLAEIHQREQAAQAHQQALTVAADYNRNRLEHLNRLQTETAKLAERRAAVVRDQDQATATRDSAHNTRTETLEQLAEPLAGLEDWQEAATQNPEDFRQKLERRCQEWRKRRTELVSHQQQRDILAPQLAEHSGTLIAVNAELGTAAGVVAGLRTRMDGLRRARTVLLGGKAVTTVRAGLNRAIASAEQAATQAGQAKQGAATVLAAAEQDARNAAAALAQRQAQAQATRAALARALTEHGLDETATRRRLAHDATWAQREWAALAVFDQAMQRAETVLSERQEQQAAHAAAAPQPTPPSAAIAEQTLIEARRAGTEATRSLIAMKSRLATDDDHRRRRVELDQAHQRQNQAYQVWAQLDQVIGSPDGARLRNVAQGVSLEVLLHHANHHLRDLARRYRLERIPGADLDLQVLDLDMGNEARGVHSLSGGETFLVSLALALGLSSMTGGVRVGTLFIDEGFGALDADSLDLALSCLEALHAGGRQVGVISHIPAMVERIGVQVKISAEGGGRSRVEVIGCDGRSRTASL